ncbi:MAG: hypothetical protein M1817_005939 [Caeruleum heppii]|nr:MAG: hypothetical protein M1817_005939 [Caeruleum heppii]
MAIEHGEQEGLSQSRTHLSPAFRPDDDTSSIRSVSEQDSDSEDDQVLDDAQNSLELAEHDRALLDEEDEREKLLAPGENETGLRRIFSGGLSNGSRVRIGRRERRRKRRRERNGGRMVHGEQGEDGELMYEMEEGGLKSDTSSISTEGSLELEREKYAASLEKRSRSSRWLRWLIIFTLIFLLFLILLLGAYKASHASGKSHTASILSNGTSLFAPTTILISLDGFRADFLQRDLTPTLNSFIAQGISPKYMLPSFPSLTFPNHFTLVTGLYPESHGVVGNTFWDPVMKEEFYYTDPTRSMFPKWWNAEPLWVTAENEGIRSAIHMWPGSEAHIAGVEPAFLDKYNGSEILSKKVHRVLEFLDMPGHDDPAAANGNQRPQFIAAYVPNVDADGHKYGPNSTEIRDTIKRVDDMLHDLFAGLEARNLTEIVNVVIVSDHGMATTSTDRLIQLDDLIDVDLVQHIDGWPLYGLRPKDPVDLRGLYDRLSVESQRNPSFDVYLRDENMPARYHFSENERIAPLWIVPKTGWAIVKKDEFDVSKAKTDGTVYHPRGLHGYDFEDPLMRAIFIARGPAFPHSPNSRMEPFQNTEIYNIICDSFHLPPKPNNGTLRLPLKPAGLHSDVEPAEIPEDLPSSPSPSPSPSPPPQDPGISVDEPDFLPDRPVVQDDHASSSADEQNDDDEKGDEENKSPLAHLWKVLGGKWGKFRAWVGEKLGNGQGEGGDGDGDGDGEREGEGNGESNIEDGDSR